MIKVDFGNVEPDIALRDKNSGDHGYCNITFIRSLAFRMTVNDTWEIDARERKAEISTPIPLSASQSIWIPLTIKAREPNKSWSGALEFWDKNNPYGN